MAPRVNRKSCMILLFIILNWVTPVRSNPMDFPVGLVLTYHIDQSVYGEWNEEYTILSQAPDLGENAFLINFSSTKPSISTQTFYVDSSSWNLLSENGSTTDSQLQPPLWIEPTQWQEGEPGTIPTYTRNYHISKQQVQIPSGTYTCWQASSIAWYPIDDDFQLSDENWYFELIHGILLRHVFTITPSQHVIHSITFNRELISSNLNHFMIFSEEEQNQIRLQISSIIFLAVGLPIILTTIVYYHKRRRSNNH